MCKKIEKEKAIIFGLGNIFLKKIALLSSIYDVIGVSDNRKSNYSTVYKFITPAEINRYDFDKIIIAPNAYYELIKKQLLDMGISIQKILNSEEALYEYDHKRFDNSLHEYRNAYAKSKLPEYQQNFIAKDEMLYPVLNDWREEAGNLGSYFWQDLWAAERIRDSGIKNHFDIGSRIDGFIAHLLVNRIEVTLFDIRPLKESVRNLTFFQTDATKLDGVQDESIDSLSALCSLEHFGLGRYGDPIDPDACFKVFHSIQRVMKKKGKIYISLPIGKEHLEFNAHRIFYPETVIKVFNRMKLLEFSVVDIYDQTNSLKCHEDIHKYDDEIKLRFGLFVFEKII